MNSAAFPPPAFPILVVLLCLATGCGGRYMCGVPEGRPCRSLAQVYQDLFPEDGEQSGEHRAAFHARGPRIRPGKSSGESRGRSLGKELASPRTERVRVLEVEPGAPLLTRPRQLRLWVSGWEDSLGDLHSESFLYLRLEEGRWSRSLEELPEPPAETP